MKKLFVIAAVSALAVGCGPAPANDPNDVGQPEFVARHLSSFVYKTCDPEGVRAIYWTNRGGVFVIDNAEECGENQ